MKKFERFIYGGFAVAFTGIAAVATWVEIEKLKRENKKVDDNIALNNIIERCTKKIQDAIETHNEWRKSIINVDMSKMDTPASIVFADIQQIYYNLSFYMINNSINTIEDANNAETIIDTLAEGLSGLTETFDKYREETKNFTKGGEADEA